MFNHQSLFKPEPIEKHFTEQDGVPVKYVCTTALGKHDAIAWDVFYRDTPHPEFGNYYFGIRVNELGETVIANADTVRDFVFTCGYDSFDNLVYSRHRHDMVYVKGGAIDGGRSYTKITDNPSLKTAAVKCGEMFAIENCAICGKNWADLVIDTLYPQKRDGSEWVYGCMVHNGGCGRQVYGGSMLEAIERWDNGAVDEYMD